MSKSPTISVLLPIGKNKKYLNKAITSIRDQTFQDFELLAKEDKGEGITQLLITLASKAKGEFLARMDGDDISMPDRFKVQVGYLRSHPQTQLVGSWATIIDKEGKPLGVKKTPIAWEEIKQKIFLENPILHPTWMMRRSWYERVEGYNPNYRFSQDWELLLRTVWKSRIENIPEPLLRYRVHKQSTSFSSNKTQLYYGLKAQLAALVRGDVSTWKGIFLLPKIGSFFIPSSVKFLLNHL